MKTNPLPSLDYLHECFEIDETSPSLLIWKSRPASHFQKIRDRNSWNGQFAGKIAGGICTKGYYHVAINRNKTPVHRIVFFLFNPDITIDGFMVDHKDGNPANNFPDNLRKANFSQNGHNSIFKGVRKSKNQWEARIFNGAKRISIGRFANEADAVQAYQDAKNKLCGEFSPFN